MRRWCELIVVAGATSVGFTLALLAATALFPFGPLLGEVKLGALLTATGTLLTIALVWWLRVGRFADRPSTRTAHHVHADRPAS